jgi:flagellar basal body-associated protein FliL
LKGLFMTDDEKKENRNAMIFIIAGVVIILVMALAAFIMPALSLAGWE